MATIAELKVKIGANVTDFDKKLSGIQAKMKETGKRMQSMGKTMSMAITAPLAAMGAVALKSFDTQVQAENKLRAALIANGEEVEKTMQDYKSFASELQKISTVGDESTLRLLQVAQSMGVTGDGAKTAASEAIALAKAMGMSEQSAIRYTAALADGDANMLTRYLPALKGIKDESAKVAKAHELLGNMMGAVTAEAQDGLGPLIQLQNQMGDLMEQFGGIIAQGLKPLIDKLSKVTSWFQTLSPTTKKIIIVVAGLAAAIGPLLVVLGFLATTILPALITGFGILLGPVGLIAAAIAGLTALVIYLWNNFEGFRGTLRGVWAALKTLASNIINKFLDIPTMIIDAFMGIPQAFIDIFSGIGDIFSAIFAGEFDKLPGLLLDAGANLLKTNPLTAVAMKMGEEFTEGMGDAFVEAFPDKIEEAAEKVKDHGAEAGETIGTSLGGEIVKGMTKEMAHAARKAFDEMAAGFGGFETKLKATKDIVQPLITDLEQARQAARAMSAAYDEKPIQILQRQREVLKQFIDTQIEGGGAITESTQKAIADYEAMGEAIAESQVSIADKISDTIKKVLEVATTLWNGMTAVVSQSLKNQSIELDNRYKKELDWINKSRMSNDQKEKAKLKLEQKVAKERKQIQIKQAKQEKAGALMSAIVNTAQGVAKALTLLFPMSLMVAAAVGAMGAAQIATIASQPIPSFATGGIVSAPMIAQIGDAPSGPEVIAPLDKLQSMLGLGGNMDLRTVIRGEDLILVIDRAKANRGFIQ